MSDFKLLAMAVKAAGLHVKGHRVDADDNFTHLIVGSKGTREKTDWNPLTNDGDALRLAARLNFRIDIQGGTVRIVDGLDNEHYLSGVATNQEDQMKVVRRAIVKAAATIGETFP